MSTDGSTRAGSTSTGLSAATDPVALLAGLVDGVRRALPAAIADGVLTVSRKRSLADRMAGRPGEIESVRLDGVEEALTITAERGRLVPEAARVSGGVVIARRRPALGEWLAAFAGEVGAIASDAAGDAAVAGRALVALGVSGPADEVAVDAGDLDGDLRSLPLRIAGRVPQAAVEAVERIAAALRDAAPRVVGSGEPEILVRRTATVYLPDTLRAFLALPSDWAERHRLADGSTAAQSLVAQLGALEDAATRMRDAAVADDAAALLTNGRFLEDRFRTSDLELP
jgi:hypothetical protein